MVPGNHTVYCCFLLWNLFAHIWLHKSPGSQLVSLCVLIWFPLSLSLGGFFFFSNATNIYLIIVVDIMMVIIIFALLTTIEKKKKNLSKNQEKGELDKNTDWFFSKDNKKDSGHGIYSCYLVNIGLKQIASNNAKNDLYIFTTKYIRTIIIIMCRTYNTATGNKWLRYNIRHS